MEKQMIDDKNDKYNLPYAIETSSKKPSPTKVV